MQRRVRTTRGTFVFFSIESKRLLEPLLFPWNLCCSILESHSTTRIGVRLIVAERTVLIDALQSDRVRLEPARYAEPWGYGLSGTPLIFGGVVADRIGNFYAGVILYFLGSVMRRSESWRDWLVLKFSTRLRSLPYTSSEKRSALAT